MRHISAHGEDEGKNVGEERVTRRVRRKGIVLIGVLLSILISGCRLTYILHVGAGHFRILNGSIPIEDALKDDGIGQKEKDHLRLVSHVKDFGEHELALKSTQNYQSVNLKSHRSPIYTISASPKDRLTRKTWWFPIVGDMPYLGFFDLNKARAEKAKLEKAGLDVTIGAADAYSTLGWFKDPLTLHLIKGDTVDLVETILHEMTHATLYLKGQGDFNESLAVLVGKMGAYQFLRKTYGPTHPLTTEARDSIEDALVFSSFLNSLIEDLEHLYNTSMDYQGKLIQREKVFGGALQEFKYLKERFRTQRYDGFGQAGLNNAYLLSISLYHRHFHLFKAVLRRNEDSIPQTLHFFRKIAKGEGAIMERLKK